MGSNPLVAISRVKFWRRLFFLILFLGFFSFIRWTKGSVFLDLYAQLTRPFWPGSAQKEWLQNAIQFEHQSKLLLLENDNKRLRELLTLKNSSSINISAPVIARSTKGWWQQLELGKGSNDAIRKGDVVFGPGGLLGTIESVTPYTSKVRLITSPGSKIGVWTARNKRHGMLIGVGMNRPKLHYLDTDAKGLPGDLVSTSPASTVVPPNMPVGVIQSIDDEAVPAPKAIVQLSASPEAIDWVQVYKP